MRLRGLVLAAAGVLILGCRPATAPVPSGSGPIVVLSNETGGEVRDLWVGVPGGPALAGAPIASLKAGEEVRLPLPPSAARLSVMYRAAPDRRFEKTIMVLYGSVRLRLEPDGAVSAGMEIDHK